MLKRARLDANGSLFDGMVTADSEGALEKGSAEKPRELLTRLTKSKQVRFRLVCSFSVYTAPVYLHWRDSAVSIYIFSPI